MNRCVMFDFGNVLAAFHTQRFYDYIRAHQPPGAIEPERLFGFACITRFDLGLIDTKEFCSEMKRHLQLNVEDEEFLFHCCDDIIEPDLRILALKQILKGNGFKLALVSNINRHHFEYIQAKYPQVFLDFDYLALSFQLGVRKPHTKMYQVPAENLGVKPEECFLIDDTKTNIDAFEWWGGIGYHYNVTNEHYCSNGRLKIERNGLVLRMINLGMLTPAQASEVVRIDFSNAS